MKPIVTYGDLRRAAFKKKFQNMFPELANEFDSFIRKPGCSSCENALFSHIVHHEDKLREFFGDVDFDVSVPLASSGSSSGPTVPVVINCSVYALADELNKTAPGPKQITASRFKDEITVILNPFEVDGPVDPSHFSVINCHIDEISSHLHGLSNGRKQIIAARYEDLATIIVNSLD